MRDDKENIIVQKTFDFALKIISFSENLRLEKKFELASQLFKSGTSIGANVREAQNAESPADFIHKFKIAAKECEETYYWLHLCKESEVLPSPKEGLIQELNIIMRIISKIISSSKKR
ncbi:four helix bundle protein [Gramella sp. AN32]|uniref:Four helix bundle protein n=1 Tax=Christiangramia antarctica TaxID=2058158 RepID=A0ABW5X0E5_9FLAO|nr:four helix bundle protein [Gramella sp. AN32]MCM4155064.1 four helix bundle protein [Gramella sp. AN32]